MTLSDLELSFHHQYSSPETCLEKCSLNHLRRPRKLCMYWLVSLAVQFTVISGHERSSCISKWQYIGIVTR